MTLLTQFDLLVIISQNLPKRQAMKSITITTITLFLFMSSVFGKVLPINRLKKNDLSAAQISANAALTNTNTTLSFGNYQNVIYYINLQVGTPSQTMGVQFDTGSNILWLPTQKAGVVPFYNTSKSSTFTNTSNPGSIEYADGSGVYGTYGTDILALSGTPINITAEFLWVIQESGMNFPSQIAGLVGMGYTTTPNFLDVAYQKNQIQSPVFTLMIQTESQQSYVYYNQIPQQIQNTTSYVSVIGNTYWQVDVLGVYVGGIDMTSYSVDAAVIDSGTSYFYLNSNLFNNVISNFFSDCDNSLSTPQCPCSSTSNWPTFSFLFDGIETYIEPSQYTAQLSLSICTYNFGTLNTVGSILLLGDIFFQGYIITFDKPSSQIGFKGNLGVVQNVIPKGSQLYGYISMGLISFAILIGLMAFCLMDQYVKPAHNLTELQQINYTSSVQRNEIIKVPKRYVIRQPML